MHHGKNVRGADVKSHVGPCFKLKKSLADEQGSESWGKIIPKYRQLSEMILIKRFNYDYVYLVFFNMLTCARWHSLIPFPWWWFQGRAKTGLYQLDLANSLRSWGADVGPREKVGVILVKAKEDPGVEQCASHTLKAASHHRGRGQSA